MSFRPISGAVPQFTRNASGSGALSYYLKFYAAGTTTPINMATDKTGLTTLVQCALNSRGEPITNNADETTVFIPYLDQSYKIVLFPSEADANANNTANALFVVDNVDLSVVFEQSEIDVSRTNFIENANFDNWIATTQTGSGELSDENWLNNSSGTTKLHSQETFLIGQTAVPNNPQFFSRTVVTSLSGASNFAAKEQRLGRADQFSNQTVTLSFWARADADKPIASNFTQNFGTGGSPSASVTGIGAQTHNLTASWQQFVTTVVMPNVFGKTVGTNADSYLALLFYFDAGTDFDADTNNLGHQSGTFDIAQVQLEIGDTNTAFDLLGGEFTTISDRLDVIEEDIGSSLSPSNMIHVQDQKPSGTEGGTFNSGSYLNRTLNTVIRNTIAGASLASNRINLPAGDYYAEFRAPANEVNRHKAKIENQDTGLDLLIGQSGLASSVNDSSVFYAEVSGFFTLAAENEIKFTHRCETTKAADGFGRATSFGDVEIYSDVKVWKVG